LADLDDLIAKKRESLKRMDDIRKCRLSPVSFSILSNSSASGINNNTSTEESPDKENIHNNSRVDMDISMKQLSTIKKEKYRPRVVLSTRNPSSSPSPLIQKTQKQQQQMQIQHEDDDNSNGNDKIIEESLNASKSRIEELERNQTEYMRYIQKLDGNIKEMNAVLEAQRSVIDQLSLQKHSHHYHHHDSDTADVSDNHQRTPSSDIVPVPAQSSVTTTTQSKENDSILNNTAESTLPTKIQHRSNVNVMKRENRILKTQVTPPTQAQARVQVQENEENMDDTLQDQGQSGSPSSIFIIRQNVPTPSPSSSYLPSYSPHYQHQKGEYAMMMPTNFMTTANSKSNAVTLDTDDTGASLIASPQVLQDLVFMLGGSILVSIVACLYYVTLRVV
jgi:hypothetical protein